MSEAIVEWTPVSRADEEDGQIAVAPPPRQALLVKVPSPGGTECHVARLDGGLWRLTGAPERTVYGVTAWARIVV